MEWLPVLLSEKNEQQSYFQGAFLPLFYYNVKRVFNSNDQEKLKGKTKLKFAAGHRILPFTRHKVLAIVLKKKKHWA